MNTVDFVALRAALVSEIREAWQTYQATHPGEDFYAFGVYSTGDCDYLGTTASTEQGLDKSVEKYLKCQWHDYSKHENLRDELRWSPCDSPLHEEGQVFLEKSHDIKGYWDYGDTQDDEQYDAVCKEIDALIDKVFETVISAFQELDAEGCFGAGADRDRIVLGIWFGDQSCEDRINFVKQLNSEHVAQRFVAEHCGGCDHGVDG